MAVRIATVLLLLLLDFGAPFASAQSERQAPPRLRIFLDCQFECDEEYLRQNIAFIDYVRDRAAADLHVLVTTEGTGGGGMSWKVQFIGQGFFEDHDHNLAFTTSQNATSDDRRREFARVFQLGLASYAAETAVAPDLNVEFRQPGPSIDRPSSLNEDPWNYWVFRVGISGNASGEQTSNNRSYRLNFSGSRTTEQWKINVSMNSNSNQSTFRVGEGTTIKSNTNGWNVNSLIVKSLGPKWSYGARSSISHSSFSNTDRSVNASPAIEFDFFPYAESSRRSLTVQYSVGLTTYKYRELTIFDKIEESVPSHSLSTSLGLRAPWGSVGGSANFSQHLNDTDRYRMSFYGQTDIRLFRGFTFNIYSQYDRIRDQIGLRKGDATTEEVLLRLQQQATGYSYYLNFGINYSFGSIFNTTVNPRF